MKILCVTGTRPELIRLSKIINSLDYLQAQGIIDFIHVYTNQNYDPNLSTIFLKDLELPNPDYTFPQSENFLGDAFTAFDKVLNSEKPDKVLILGDTNSGLLAILAEKKGIPVYHMEAGSRCMDKNVPEETNRKIIDACSTYNLPYTDNGKENLLKEGHDKNHVFKTGNPIWEVLHHYEFQINSSNVLSKYKLTKGSYALFTMHRAENVDDFKRLTGIIEAINEIAKKVRIIFPMHPRTEYQINRFKLKFLDNVHVISAIGFFDFVKLEKNASFIITDSGTVPEEASLFMIPCMIIRNTIERQELIENGLVNLCGTTKQSIMNVFNSLITDDKKGILPNDYIKSNVSETVIKILMSDV